ncbi:DUF1778 domain-containing protein [Synechocystis sp. PCC 7509]|uniref:DUF1778 domain-containing protein n=1 Tax=Synechocystis sp. PCC 7509 TaxID=927677 RepID=UPI0002ACDCE0|nr:DUF1778 domain-containing protein [Synechocystis sp. PCC 7509]
MIFSSGIISAYHFLQHNPLFHLLPAAKQEVDSYKKLVLSNHDRDLFLSVMDNPPQLAGKLKGAIKKYREKYEK